MLFVLFVGMNKNQLATYFLPALTLGDLWMRIIAKWKTNFIFHKNAKNIIPAWMSIWRGKQKRILWRITFFATIWHLWFLKNKIKFDNVEANWDAVFDSINFTALEWYKAKHQNFPYSVAYTSNNVDVIWG